MFDSRKRTATALVALTAIAAGTGAAASRAAHEATACSLVSTGQARSVTGLSQSMVLKDVNGTTKLSHAAETECIVGAWSGTTPTSPDQIAQIAKAGNGAEIGIETWTKNTGPSGRAWPADYRKLTRGFVTDGATFPGLFSAAGMTSKHLALSAMGFKTTGLQFALTGRMQGVVAAMGCWWNDKKQSAVCVLVEESAQKPFLNHLSSVAKLAVRKFL